MTPHIPLEVLCALAAWGLLHLPFDLWMAWRNGREVARG